VSVNLVGPVLVAILSAVVMVPLLMALAFAIRFRDIVEHCVTFLAVQVLEAIAAGMDFVTHRAHGACAVMAGLVRAVISLIALVFLIVSIEDFVMVIWILLFARIAVALGWVLVVMIHVFMEIKLRLILVFAFVTLAGWVGAATQNALIMDHTTPQLTSVCAIMIKVTGVPSATLLDVLEMEILTM